jgi:Holliday junction resolvase YEN1
MGVVDYVISNDSDTLSFGAKKILRNFSKYEENHSSASGSGLKQTTEFWVTPIRMDQVRRLKGYDCDRLVFISILCGADYNDGVAKLGPQRSSQLSLCGTSKIRKYSATFPYDELHGFSKELSNLYKTNADGLSGKKRTLRYENFQQRVFDMVKQNSVALFGRNEHHLTDQSTTFAGWPPEFVVGLYYRPLICPSSKLFKFRDNTMNNAESSDPETAFTIPYFEEIYQQIKEYPLANLSNIALWYLKEMSSAYLLKHFRAHKTKVWEDDELFKFQKVRFQKLGSDEPQTHVIELLSVKLMEHGLPHFGMDGYTSIATQNWSTVLL